MVGLGTQDSYGDAVDFVERYGTTSFRMLYDESFQSWTDLGIRGQPAAILFDTEGNGQYTWFGAFDEDEVLELAASL